MIPEAAKLVDVRGLTTAIDTGRRIVPVVDDVSFHVDRREVLGLVGESGCGKTLTALSIVGLLPRAARVLDGNVWLDGVDVLQGGSRAMRRVRGGEIGVVFQDPMESLNPVMTVGRQIAEAVRTNLDLSARASRERAAEVLNKVGIPDAKQRMDDYPHQFSGGMRQRVMVAIAIACEPSLLIADEPTTALDVTIQAQILELIRDLRDELGMGVLLITHDLGIAAGMCDRVNVMYAGRIVESAPVEDLFARPEMPYTRALLAAIPTPLDAPGSRLRTIEGQPPAAHAIPPGCRFAPRCEHVREVCRQQEPVFAPRGHALHRARCWATEADGWLA